MPDVKRDDPEADAVTSHVDGGQIEDESGQRLIPANKVNEIVSTRVNELNQKHSTSIATLQAQIDHLTKQTAEEKEPEKVYSRAELDVFVDEGRLSQDEADQVIQKQMTKQVTNNVMNDLSLKQSQDAQQALIERYVAHDPDVAIPGTPSRQRIEQEVLMQQKLTGDPTLSLKHETLALRAIYGDIDKITAANLDPRQRDTHMDIHSANNSFDSKSHDSDTVSVENGVISGLSRDEKNYYQDLISKGFYSNWEEVAKEMKYADNALRSRVRARQR